MKNDLPPSPWAPPPAGFQIPEEGEPLPSNPKATTSLDHRVETWEIYSQSHEELLQAFLDDLNKKGFGIRTNGEDFLVLSKLLPFMTQVQGTVVLTTSLENQEYRLSECEPETQDALHRGEGGFLLTADLVTQRVPWVGAWPLLTCLLVGAGMATTQEWSTAFFWGVTTLLISFGLDFLIFAKWIPKKMTDHLKDSIKK